MAEPLMSLIDTAFVSRCGVIPLAALGPNTALFNVIFFIGYMAMAVVTVDNMARANAQGDRAGVGRAFVLAVAAAAAVGLACAALVIALPEQALSLFQTNAEIMPDAKVYCVLRAVSTPFALLNVVFQAAFRALLDVQTPLLVVAVAGVANLVLDPLLIFTFNMGIAGAAIATSAAQILGSVMFMAASVPPAGKGRRAKWGALLRDLPWLEFFMQCRGLALRASLILSTYTFAAMAAARLGTIQIAAHQVIQQLQQLQLAMAWSFLSVGQTMVANVYAQADGRAQARAIGSRIALWGVALSAVLAAGTWAARDALPRVFIQAEAVEVLEAIAPAMLPACAMLAFSCNNAFEGVLLGAGDARFVVGVYPPSVFLGLALLAGSTAVQGGLTGIWWALAVYYVCLVVSFATRMWGPIPAFRGPYHQA